MVHREKKGCETREENNICLQDSVVQGGLEAFPKTK